jgi:hypothetical protein
MRRRERRIVFGAAAGIAATVAMTAAMRVLYKRLPREARYPLPPREITERVLGAMPHTAQLTVESHLVYGAGAGAFYSLLQSRNTAGGAVYGIAIWLVSYLGWIPALSILKAATRHPASRNEVMLLAHIVWGAALAASMRQLESSEHDIFGRGPNRDAPLD